MPSTIELFPQVFSSFKQLLSSHLSFLLVSDLVLVSSAVSYSYQILSWSRPPLLHLMSDFVRRNVASFGTSSLVMLSDLFKPCHSLQSLLIDYPHLPRSHFCMRIFFGVSSNIDTSSSQNNGFRHMRRHNILCTISQLTARSSDSARLGKYYSTQELSSSGRFLTGGLHDPSLVFSYS